MSFALPDDIIDTARALLDGSEAYQWQLGDFLTDVVDEFGRQHRAAIIRELSSQTGADASTLRDRQIVAAFFPRAVRDLYPFTWSQWRALKSAGPEHWQEHAEYWVEHLPAPVAAIRKRIKGNGHTQDERWQDRLELMLEMARLLAEDEAAPVDARRLGVDVLACGKSHGYA